MFDKKFIEKCEALCEPLKEKSIKDEHEAHLKRIRKWNDQNREKLRKSIRAYSKTDKGLKATKKRTFNRIQRFNKAFVELTPYQKQCYEWFVENTPEGYSVDHIIPLCKGGSHCITNLQYITLRDNYLKATNLDYKCKTAKLTKSMSVKIGIMKSKIIKMKENRLSNVASKE